MRFDAGIVDVPGAGTREQVSNTPDRVLWIKFTALEANSGITYVGLLDVDSSPDSSAERYGYPLEAAGGIDATLELDFAASGGSVPMSTFWVDAATNGDDVAYAVIYE
jgi:hypothetical protein